MRVPVARRVLGAVGATVAVLAAVVPGAASAQDGGTGLLVTVAARACPTYESITANLARNDIQESLRDLGPNTPYVSGEPINPVKEADNQTQCVPLTNWKFVTGTGIGGTVTGTWGSLSKVSNPFDASIRTLAQTPMLDDKGQPVAGASIAGATTFALDRAQASAASDHILWIQGGAVDDPVSDQEHPGAYGFGALRCSVDNLNGDNVETVNFPSGARHVFCYAYYVTPPPSSGTLIVRKVVTGAPAATESFVMEGNVSYDPSGTFALNVNNGQPAAQTFFRGATPAGAAPWTVKERASDGWILTDLTCTHGASTVTTDRATGQADITLAAGDTVTCTYTNAPKPVLGALLIRKVTNNSIGSFSFFARSLSGALAGQRAISTQRIGVAAPGRPIPLAPGRYRVTEAATGAGKGLWTQKSLTCDGKRSAGVVDIPAGGGAICTFTNERRYIGRIAIKKVTQNGTGTAGFQIAPVTGTPVVYNKAATTHRTDDAVTATGDSTTNIPLGAYVIREFKAASDQEGTWALVRVSCDGKLVPFAQGRALVRLTSNNPQLSCTFTNRRSDDATKPPPTVAPPPTTTPPVVTPPPTFPPTPVAPPVYPTGTPGTAGPNLTITKTASTRTPRLGDVVTYRMVVENTGPVAATDVVVGEQPGAAAQLVSARTTQGTCGEELPLVCRLGTVEAGASATIVVRLQVTDVGRLRNVAVVGSSSTEARLADNIGVAGVVVRHNPRIDACASSARPPRAHAAC